MRVTLDIGNVALFTSFSSSVGQEFN